MFGARLAQSPANASGGSYLANTELTWAAFTRNRQKLRKPKRPFVAPSK